MCARSAYFFENYVGGQKLSRSANAFTPATPCIAMGAFRTPENRDPSPAVRTQTKGVAVVVRCRSLASIVVRCRSLASVVI